MTSAIVVTPKRHLLARKHVVWAIKCENRSNGSTWARARVDRTGQDSPKKSQMRYISPICGEDPTEPIYAKICMVIAIRNIITCVKFWTEIFRGYDFTGGWIFGFLLILAWTIQQCSVFCAYESIRMIRCILQHLRCYSFHTYILFPASSTAACLCRIFHVPHFPPLQFYTTFSCLAFSIPAFWIVPHFHVQIFSSPL